MKQSPKQQLMALANASASDKGWRHEVGDYKSAVLEKLLPYLDRNEDESEQELKERLLTGEGKGRTRKNGISNKKLLKLHNVVERLKADFGGKKENLVNALLDTKKGESGKSDEGYRAHLNKKSIATLLLWHDHAKKAGEIEA